MGIHKEAFGDLLKRYFTVWRNVWKVRKELDPPKRDKHERDFLPAQLELTETPISPLPKWTARLIMLFALLALLWAWRGELDIVVVAQGKTEPTGKSKVIQPLETAEVKAIAVTDGQHVEIGDTLLELSVVGGEADIAQSETALQAVQLSKLRNEALLVALDKQQSPRLSRQTASALKLPEADITAAQTLVQNQYQAWSAQNQQLDAVIRGHQAELRVAQSQLDKLIATGKIDKKRADDLAELVKKKFIAEHTYLEQKTKVVANQKDQQSQRNQLTQIKASIEQAKEAQRVNTQNLRRDTLDALRQASEQATQLQAQRDKATQRQSLMTLRAPVAGKVQQLAIHTIGGVVTAAQQVMVIVPDDYQMHINALVLNKDIGFIKAGQEAVIKAEAFPYTRYGYLTGKISDISFDAIENEQLGLVYQATITMDSDTLNINGQAVRLSSGMNVTAEIKTGKRTVLEYLLSPLQTTIDDSMKQR